jgi:hypothetical protein
MFAAALQKCVLENVRDIVALRPHPDFASVRTRTLDIDNVVYASPVFRKIHLETASSPPAASSSSDKGGVSITHLVLHPRLSMRALPILSMDVVILSGRPTMCIADACPTTPSLSTKYRDAVLDLQRRHEIRSTRAVPEWGREIFSDTCIITNGENYEIFEAYALDLLEMHVREYESWPMSDAGAGEAGDAGAEGEAAGDAGAGEAGDAGAEGEAAGDAGAGEAGDAGAGEAGDAEGAAAASETKAAHDRYRRHQMMNDRTRRMLIGVFDGDAARAEAYMEYVFD